MIREFSAKAKPTNSKARMIFCFSAAAAVAVVLISMIIPVYRGIVSLVGMMLFVLAVVVYTKYVSATYYYDITFDSEGTALFVVRQIIGKRETTLCRIGLFEVTKVEKESKESRAAHKTPYGFRKYSYLPTLFPDTTCRITTMSRYEKAEIVIEANDEFISLLDSYCKEARELRMQDDDEY